MTNIRNSFTLTQEKTNLFFRYRSDGYTYVVNSFFTTVKVGSRGEDVKVLQNKLKKLGFRDSQNKELVADGIFGKNTEYALKNFQKKMKLTADGIAGPKTWVKI